MEGKNQMFFTEDERRKPVHIRKRGTYGRWNQAAGGSVEMRRERITYFDLERRPATGDKDILLGRRTAAEGDKSRLEKRF